MADGERVEKISKVRRSIDSFKKILDRQGPGGIAPDREQFEALMRQDRNQNVKLETMPERRLDPSARPSLMDEVASVNSRVEQESKYSAHDLVSQARDAVQRIDQIQTQLSQPELRIKSSVQQLLKNKLGNINDNLKSAFDRAGLDYVPPEDNLRANPVRRFLDMLAHGQENLNKLSNEISGMQATGKDVSPADLLAMQLKVHHVGQELEFFTALLNKSLESTKTLMNTQV